MQITFRKTADRPSTILLRDDGVRYALRAVDRKFTPPHDIVHVIVESALGLEGGFIGSIAQGAIFKSMQHMDGRRRPNQQRRSTEVIRRNDLAIRASEVAVGAFQEARLRSKALPYHDLTQRLSHIPQLDLCRPLADRTWNALNDAGRIWQSLRIDETVVLDWPYTGMRH